LDSATEKAEADLLGMTRDLRQKQIPFGKHFVQFSTLRVKANAGIFAEGCELRSTGN
jgi:hypothetical protein